MYSPRSFIRNMNSLPFFVLFHVLTGIHGKGIISNHNSELNKTENWPCKEFNETDTLFSCFYKNYHQDRECIEIVQMTIYSAMNENFTDEWFVKQSKILCTDDEGNNRCSEEDCRQVLLSAIESVSDQHNMTAKEKDSHNCDYDKGSVTDDVETSTSWKENGRQKDKKDKRKKGKEKLFKLGAIVGISVGITGTIILFFVILMTFFICRRRSKKKKRKQHTIQMSIDQRLAIEKYESGSFSTNRGGFNVLSANIPLVADEAQGEYFVPDPSITKYDKDFSNRKLPEIKKCSGADGDDDVYYEIDEDKMKSSTDMEGVYQNEIKEVTDKGSNDSDQTGYEIPLGSIKKKREQLTKQQSIDQRSDIASLENNPFSTNNKTNTILFANESLNTDEAQGDYFVLDPAITKYNKDLSSLVLPETKMFSDEHGDERVYNEIDDYEIQPPRDIEGVHQKKIEEAMDKCSYNGEQNTYETPVSKKNKREQLKRPHSVDQGTEISHLENCPSSTNKGDNAIISANESLNTDEAEGEYFILDPSVTKYNKDLSSLVLPIVKRFSVSNGDESVYTEIDEDKIESSPDKSKDHEKQIGENGDIVICHSDQTNNIIQLGFDKTSSHATSEAVDEISKK